MKLVTSAAAVIVFIAFGLSIVVPDTAIFAIAISCAIGAVGALCTAGVETVVWITRRSAAHR